MGKINDDAHFETLAVHAGVTPDPTTGAIMTPIFASSTYVQESPGKHKGYEYSRAMNIHEALIQPEQLWNNPLQL